MTLYSKSVAKLELGSVMRTLLLVVTLLVAAPVAAQDQGGPFFLRLDGLAVVQGDADLDGGGDFSASRVFARAGGLYRFNDRISAGLFISRGAVSYDFGGGAAAPWGDVTEDLISAPIRFSLGEEVSAFVAPSLRYDYEDGADRSDGETYGAFAGAVWRVSERLSIGPAFGVFTEIGSDDLNAFPALLIDWDITERLNLSSGPTIGASQGPGLALDYAVNDDFTIGLAGRYENTRFRLSDTGPTPGGLGEDKSFPLVVTFDYAPNPGLGVSAFAGAELGGRLRIEDADGAVIDTQDYDPAPVFGAAIRLAF